MIPPDFEIVRATTLDQTDRLALLPASRDTAEPWSGEGQIKSVLRLGGCNACAPVRKPINVRARVASVRVRTYTRGNGKEIEATRARSFLDPRDLRVPVLLRIPKLPINPAAAG